jgi:cell division protein FtsZ
MAEPENNLRPRLTVMGIGGAGGNALNNMIRCNLEGCDFIAANTDAQALAQSLAPRKIQLGVSISRGLGAGSKPDVGRGAAEEQIAEILASLEGSDMLFVTAGMGGGTGTGAAPVIARAARESGILTVGVVTKPFHFEGSQRMRKAESGIAELQQYVDTLIVIPNQNLFRIANEHTTFAEAFRMADEVLHSGVRGITDLMVMPGFMNLDFADVKTVMDEMGKAMMGTGEAEGENRAIRAAEAAISNPLLDDVSMKGARGVLINITGGMDMTLFEVDQAANRIREEVDSEAQIKVGSTLGEDLDGRIRVSVIATGIEANVVNVQQRGTSSGTGHLRVIQDPMRRPATVHLQTQNQSPASQTQPQQQQPQPQQHQQIQPPPAQDQQQGYFAMPPAATPQMMEPPPQPQQAPPPAPVHTVQYQQPVQHAPPPPPMQQQAPVQQAPVYRPPVAPQQVQRSAPPPPPQHQPQAEPQQQQPAGPPPIQRYQPDGGLYAQPRGAASPQLPLQTPREAAAQHPFDMRINTQMATPQQQAAAEQRRTRRSESLFTRITGFGMVRPSEQEGEEAPEGDNGAPPLGIDPADRPALSSSEPNDLLDIPAFLRRQTNH